ncbi:hypothetical protein DPMN_076901 [Dreissena polymorpha]|uniref:Uncharacterized protein n=1 Tax=Dreissena polymorpha TaxID=45954 RepID=A0A9D3YMF3_DREPO|nr:hypothetical protein DPMN_076901 [Dreissena polymorpha]
MTRHRKNARPPGGHAFQPIKTLFIQDKIMMNLLIKVYEDRTINVASRVFTRKNAPPPDIIGTNLLTKVLARKKAPPPPLGGHVFQPTGTVFKLIKDIIGTNLLTKFHEDLTINDASRVLTRRNAPALGSYVFQANVIIFKVIEDIIGKNLLSKFHKDRQIDVASRVLTRKNAPPHGGHVFQ